MKSPPRILAKNTTPAIKSLKTGNQSPRFTCHCPSSSPNKRQPSRNPDALMVDGKGRWQGSMARVDRELQLHSAKPDFKGQDGFPSSVSQVTPATLIPMTPQENCSSPPHSIRWGDGCHSIRNRQMVVCHWLPLFDDSS